MMDPNNKLQCEARVWVGFHHRQCSRPRTIDNFCKQHHPDTIAAKRRKRDEKFNREIKLCDILNRISSVRLNLIEIVKEERRSEIVNGLSASQTVKLSMRRLELVDALIELEAESRKFQSS